MSNNTGDKIPVEIVTTILDKISDFTKEMEVLRSSIPTKEIIDILIGKVDKASLIIKTFFAVIGTVVALAFLGAQFMDWSRQQNLSDKAVNQQVMEEKINSRREAEYAKQLQQIQQTQKYIFEKLESIENCRDNNSNNINIDDN